MAVIMKFCAGQGLVASITQGQNAHAGQVIFVLLNHVVQRARMDSTVRLDVSTIADMTSSSTVLATAKRLASDIFMAPAKAFTGLLQSQSSFLLAPVADASLSLLLLLLYEDDMGAQHRASSLQSSFAVWCQRYKLSGHFLVSQSPVSSMCHSAAFTLQTRHMQTYASHNLCCLLLSIDQTSLAHIV